ncbi:LOW QUALITY PROTEIN: Trafficking protein particle complex subunit [Phytophthora megakarya]|uniref:Trafficking protein particle complex subunit n=1 Tax=Phytophthora megakarya TaxID=4795 RepID=A0A225VSG1_9STRA|nr:LOW QUALITY PROTEIN: Trafficking protein particle complex subunit [Phytophthora megakarya]
MNSRDLVMHMKPRDLSNSSDTTEKIIVAFGSIVEPLTRVMKMAAIYVRLIFAVDLASKRYRLPYMSVVLHQAGTKSNFEYEFQVEYRPGSTNVVGDAISRAPVVVRMVAGRLYQHVPMTNDTEVETTTVTTVSGMVNTPNLADGKDVAVATTVPAMIELVAMNQMARTAPTDTIRTDMATVGETPTADNAASAVMTSRATVRGVNARGDTTTVVPDLQASSTEHILRGETTVETPGATITNDSVVGLNGAATTSDDLSDDDIVTAQKSSEFTKRLMTAGKYGSMRVKNEYGLVVIETCDDWQVLLPPTLWAPVFKEIHGSVWNGHLRGPHTYGRVAQLYWWPGLSRVGFAIVGTVDHENPEVIPPLQSRRGGAVGDRWTLNVAGPFPVENGGDRYVVAAIEYVTRYVVASCVTEHTIVLKFGVFSELLTDGACGIVPREFSPLLQTQQVNPVLYRAQLVGLAEHFDRTWKDRVSTPYKMKRNVIGIGGLLPTPTILSGIYSVPNTKCVDDGKETTGTKRVTPTSREGDLHAYHASLLEAMKRNHGVAKAARTLEQERHEQYYRKFGLSESPWKAVPVLTIKKSFIRAGKTPYGPRDKENKFHVGQVSGVKASVGDPVWVHNPPRGKNATKFVHQWQGYFALSNLLATKTSSYDGRTRKAKAISDASDISHRRGAPVKDPWQTGVNRRQQRLFLQRRLLLHEQRSREVQNDPELQWMMLSDPTTNVASRWSADVDGDATQHDSTFLSTNCIPEAIQTSGRLTAMGRARARWTSVAEYERLYRGERVVDDPTIEEIIKGDIHHDKEFDRDVGRGR